MLKLVLFYWIWCLMIFKFGHFNNVGTMNHPIGYGHYDIINLELNKIVNTKFA